MKMFTMVEAIPQQVLDIPTFEIAILWAIMIAMGAGMAVIIILARKAYNPLQKLLVYLLLAMMNGMLVGPLIYLLFPGILTVEGAVEASLALMAVEMIPFLFTFLRAALSNSENKGRSFLLAFTILFVILDEILMSLDFNLVTYGSSFLLAFHRNAAAAVVASLASYWFVFPMSMEMFLSSFLLRKSVRPAEKVVFWVQAALMFLAPTAFHSSSWIMITVYLSGAVMTGFFVFLFEQLYRVQGIGRRLGRYILLLMLTYTFMMAGVFIFQVYSVQALFGLSMVLDMVIYLAAMLRPDYFNTGGKLYWLADRRWSFLFLMLVFSAEFFMGAAFDAQYYGPMAFMSSTGVVALGSGILQDIPRAVFDFFMFFADVSLSSWFLVMMGIEMGSLVVFKIPKTRDLETKIRLLLMLLAYAIYSILLPSFILPDPAAVPFVGWSMGIGTAGPVAPALIVPMILTYVISGILSLLFGSRQLCSVFCTAPVMYQGTFYDSMKKFNRSSGLSKSLTSADRMGNLVYRVVSNLVYISIIVAAVISWLDSTGHLNLTFYGTDPEYMLYLVYFGFLWYAVFILMPYVGSYGCINTGYCHWGNFNRFVSRFGFFRLKVRDPNQCLNCPTKDCATACPVGNYGQPGSFIRTGEYKDSRCVGIGDCVNACPYENIFYYDVRHWIREKVRPKQD